MGRELSLAALSELRTASPHTSVVILTMEEDPAFVTPAWNAGAAGYVLKEASRGDLVTVCPSRGCPPRRRPKRT
jgi:DNA-binding NarL/FixJ family response regulator